MDIALFFYALSMILVAVECRYSFYYTRPSYRGLYSKIEELEAKIQSIQQNPVHVHLGVNQNDGDAKTEGTNVFVHLKLDGQGECSTAGQIQDGDYAYAKCQLISNTKGPQNNIQGMISLRQKHGSNIEIRSNIRGMPGKGMFGFHVHESADFTNGCNSFGGHFNPFGKNHGGPDDQERHVGDLGNIVVDDAGNVRHRNRDGLASLFGQNSIVGRGIVIHGGEDDLGRGGDAGSLKTGNAGPRLACCTIGWAKDGSLDAPSP